MTSFQTESLLEYLLVEYRWIFVLFILLPMSAVWKVWSTIRNYVVFKMNSAPKKHDQKVKEVQRQIKEWLARDRKTRLCTARPSWQTMNVRHGLYKKTYTNIKINLVDVLEIDTDKMTVRCEPLATMGQLSKILQPMGLSIPVVPELDQLTVGGLVMGTGVETSSHIYGLFQHSCIEFELVLADGSVVTCSKDNNPDLFYSVPWSYGTLGFLTSVVIKLIPAKKYVRLEYHPYNRISDIVKHFNEESVKKNPHHFLEGVVFTKNSGVVMVGDMVDEVGTDGTYNPIGKWYAEWFYKQVEKHLKRNEVAVDYIPLRDYYHRHTKGLFWELEEIVSFGNNSLFRFLFGWLMPPEIALLKLTQPDAVGKLYDRSHVLQDMMVPVKHMEESLNFFHEDFQVYPIWLCPFRVFNRPGLLKIHSNAESEAYVNIGLYGIAKAKGYEAAKSTRRVEKFVMEHKGFQMLYADIYSSEEEFRQMYDHTLYDKMRDSLPHCKEAFPVLFGKVNKKARR